MLSLIICSCLAFTQVSDAETKAPDPALVAKVIAGLDRAVEIRSEGALINAIHDCQEVEDEAVIERVAAALKHRKSGIRKTAINVLRWMKHKNALAALTKSYLTDKRLHKIPDLVSRTLMAIGQHQDPASIDLFVHPPAVWLDEPIIRARIRGLGRLRTKTAVAELIALMDAGEEWKARDYAADFRISLQVLTGLDKGPHLSEWQKWWRKHHEKVVISQKVPELPKDVVQEWRTYWSLPIEVDPNEVVSGREQRRRDNEKKEKQ